MEGILEIVRRGVEEGDEGRGDGKEGTWEERGHMGGERTYGRREDIWEEREREGTWEKRGHMGGERSTWEERGHMEGERSTWEERGHMGGERSTWEERGHMGRERAPPSPLLPHHCQVLIAALRTIYP